MCYTCGCNMPDNPHGKGHAGTEADGLVTNQTFVTDAKTEGEADLMDEPSSLKAKNNAVKLLAKVLGIIPCKVVRDDSGYLRYDDAVPDADSD